MADQTKEILILFNVDTGEYETSLGQAGKGLDNLSKSIDNATKSQERYSKAAQDAAKTSKELSKLQEDQARSAGLAGIAAFELGRTISDLPFGFVAISNNISQLGTLFAALVANAGSARKAFELLKQQILSPTTGLLIAFQIVTAAVTYFSRQTKEAENSIKEFSNAAVLQGKALQELQKLFLELNGPLLRQLELLKALALEDEGLAAILENQNISQRQQVEIAKEYVTVLQDLSKREAEVIENKNKIEKANKDLNISEEQIVENNKEILRLEKELADQVLKDRGFSEARENRIAILKGQNAQIQTQLDLLTGVSRQLNYIASERERIAELSKMRTDFIFLTEEEYEAQQEASEDNLKLVEDFRLKLIDLTAQTETERLNAQREAALKRIQEGENYKQAEVAINEYFDAKIVEAQEKAAKEKAEAAKKGLDEEIKDLERALKEKDRIIKQELRNLESFIKEQQNLAVLRQEVRALETGDDRSFLEWKKSFYFKLSEDQSFSEAERLRFKKLFLQAKNELDQEDIDSDKALAEKKRAQQEYMIGLAQDFFNSVIALSDAQMKAEMDREEAKTIALNDQLRERLRNEELSADQRDKINQEIAQNEAALIEKQNELEEKRFKQQKAANIANAVINTYLAATQALANPLDLSGPLKIASAGLVIASGLASVAAIASQEFVPKASPNPALTSQGGGGIQAPSFNVVGASRENQLAAAVTGALQDRPVKAYVVSSDVSSAQELERNIIEGASI